MRQIIAIILLVLIGLGSAASFQSTIVSSGSSLPANCVVGGIYEKTGTSAGLYICLATNTWSGPLAVSGATGDVTAASAFGTDNRLIRSDGTGKGVQASGVTLDDSDIVTGLKYDAEGTGNTLTIPSIVYFNMGVCQDTTGALGFSFPATGTAPTSNCLTETNIRTGEARFDDDGAEREVQSHFTLPDDWTGTVDMKGKWRSADTSGSVVWQVQTACVADGEKDPSWNTVQKVTDAAKGTTLQENDFSLSSVTTTGCAAGEEFFFRIFRDSDDASDDLATSSDGIARLIAVRFIFRRAM